jgi:outer membrane immunogenic protein
MRNWGAAVVLFVCGVMASAQNYPRVEVFGGYSYLNFDVPNVPALEISGKRLNANGWEAAAAFDLVRHLGVVADFSGHYISDCYGFTGVNCNHYSFLFGPRLTFGSPEKGRLTGYAHALVGADRISGAASVESIGLSASNNSLGVAAGGGLDYWITRRVGIRLGQADYLFTRHVHDFVPAQHNFRVSAGIVFSLGGHSSAGTEHPSASAASRPATSRATMSVPALGIVVSPPLQGDEGAEIVGVDPGSIAALAILHVGDLINSVDGKPVRTPMELAAELANRPQGSRVRLGYLYHTSALGFIPKETIVILGGNH